MFFWNSKKTANANNEVTVDRHLRELTTAFPSIHRPNNDNSCFEIPLPNRPRDLLMIFIPSEFPVVGPRLLVKGATINHPWLNSSNRVVNCPKLNSWDRASSSLLEIVHDCIHQFKQASEYPLNPGSPEQIFHAKQQHHQHQAYSASSGKTVSGIVSLAPRHRQAPPDIPNSFPELENMSEQQLQRLLCDEEALEKHAEKYSNIYALESVYRQLESQNAMDGELLVEESEQHRSRQEEYQRLNAEFHMELMQFERIQEGCSISSKALFETTFKEQEELDRKSESISKEMLKEWEKTPETQERMMPKIMHDYETLRKQYHSNSIQIRQFNDMIKP